MAKEWVQVGGDINTFLNDNTMLTWAVKQNYKNLTEYLLRKGADKSIQNSNGKTASQLAKSKEIKDLFVSTVEFGKKSFVPKGSKRMSV
jgi:ankyrin repeat protein